MKKIEAIRRLIHLPYNRIIDSNWFEDGLALNAHALYDLIAILTLAKQLTYKDVLNKYEGLTIDEFLEKVLEL